VRDRHALFDFRGAPKFRVRLRRFKLEAAHGLERFSHLLEETARFFCQRQKEVAKSVQCGEPRFLNKANAKGYHGSLSWFASFVSRLIDHWVTCDEPATVYQQKASFNHLWYHVRLT
jgi:hypothetical protein